MNAFLTLRNRTFDVTSAVVEPSAATWSVNIETGAKEFDGEVWAPRLYHQGLHMPSQAGSALEGMRTSWKRKADASYPHPELGLMYVFGHHDVYQTVLSFGRARAGRIELAWDGLCDVFWSDGYDEAVPFRCRCIAELRQG